MENPQDYDSNIHYVIILDNLNKQQLNDERVQILFERRRHDNLSVFVITHGFYELPKDTTRENSTIIYLFMTISFANVEFIHRQLTSTDMVIKELKHFVNIVWSEDFNFITTDLTKKKNKGKYRKKLDTIYVPFSDTFK